METHRLALTAGYQIEHFRIESILGKGGFGITYVALDLQLGKRVAIKELLPDSIATRIDGSTVVPQSASLQENWEWARERFQDEAKILAGFSHPAIVGVHRLIEANGTVYMVMDYVDGESYEAKLRRIGRESDQASLMAVISPILDGLREVHEKGLLHRDIKPENILINRRGQPILIDFGSARLAIGATMTMTSIVTHGYSPAEQYQTKGKMGAWTDIYALGAVMCRAITGEKPPVAADRLMEDDFQWLSNRKPEGFDERFLQAVDWALRVRPEDRPSSISTWESGFGDASYQRANPSTSSTIPPPASTDVGTPEFAERHSEQFHITKNGQQSGPYNADYIRQLIASGTLDPSDLCWHEGMADWQTIGVEFNVQKSNAETPPELPAHYTSPNTPPPIPKQAHFGDSAIERMLLPVGRSLWAIAAGYLGLFSLVILPAPIALIISIIAIRDIQQSKARDHPKHGMGRAIFGLVMGILGTVLLVLCFVPLLLGR